MLSFIVLLALDYVLGSCAFFLFHVKKEKWSHTPRNGQKEKQIIRALGVLYDSRKLLFFFPTFLKLGFKYTPLSGPRKTECFEGHHEISPQSFHSKKKNHFSVLKSVYTVFVRVRNAAWPKKDVIH